jgi:hypothetical protein
MTAENVHAKQVLDVLWADQAMNHDVRRLVNEQSSAKIDVRCGAS